MNADEKLKDLILSKYKSVRAFSIDANIPYSTIATIFKRGVLNTNINTMNKICYTLNTTVDELLAGTPEKELINQESTNRNLELEIIHTVDNYGFNESELTEILSFVNYIKAKRQK